VFTPSRFPMKSTAFPRYGIADAAPRATCEGQPAHKPNQNLIFFHSPAGKLVSLARPRGGREHLGGELALDRGTFWKKGSSASNLASTSWQT